MENMAAIRSAPHAGRTRWLPVRFGTADSFHLAQYRTLQLVRGRKHYAGAGGIAIVDDNDSVGVAARTVESPRVWPGARHVL